MGKREKIFGKWYENFTESMGEFDDDELFEAMHSLITSGKNTFAVNRKIMQKAIDTSWVDAIEKGLVHVDNVLRAPRKTIEDVEEIVPIALSRKITVESVKHLAQHTDLIQEYDPVSRKITPSKVLNVHKEESMLTYENKFVNTLIDRLYIFISRRYEKLSEVSNDEEAYSMNYSTDLDDKLGRKMKVSLAIETIDSLETKNSSGLTVWERVENLKSSIESYKGSQFCQAMGNAYIRPPVMRTNAIMKNVDLKACLTLWQFIESYDKVGYEISVSDTAQKIDDNYLNDLYDLIALNFLLFRSYTKDKPSDFTDLRTKNNKAYSPRFLRRFVKPDTSAFDILVNERSDDGEPVNINAEDAPQPDIGLLEEIDRVIKLEKAYITEEALINAEKIRKREEEERRREEAERKRLEKIQKEAAEKAERERIEREKREAEEAERLKQEWEARQKAEAEERERQRLEAIERAEREKREAEERRQREYDNFRRQQLTKERIEAERIAAEKARIAEANLTPEQRAERERLDNEKRERERREKMRAERLKAERAMYEKRDFRTIYLEYSRSPLCVIRRFFILIIKLIFNIPVVPDVDPIYWRSEHPKGILPDPLLMTKAEHEEQIQMVKYYRKYSTVFPYNVMRMVSDIKFKLTHKKKPLSDAEKEKLRKSLPIRTPEEQKAYDRKMRKLFRKYHVFLIVRLGRFFSDSFKRWRSDSEATDTDIKSFFKKLLRAIDRLIVTAAILLLAALIFFTVYVFAHNSKGEQADVFGYSVMKVVTGSMEPTIHENDFILVKETDVSELGVGDIICFKSSDPEIYGKLNTHRICGINEDGSFVTRGDANPIADRYPVSPDKIVGKYTRKVKILRFVNSFGDKRKLLLLLVILPMFAVSVYEAVTVAKTGKEYYDEVHGERSAAKEKLIREEIEKQKQLLRENGLNDTESDVIKSESGETDEAQNGDSDSAGDDSGGSSGDIHSSLH